MGSKELTNLEVMNTLYLLIAARPVHSWSAGFLMLTDAPGLNFTLTIDWRSDFNLNLNESHIIAYSVKHKVDVIVAVSNAAEALAEDLKNSGLNGISFSNLGQPQLAKG